MLKISHPERRFVCENDMQKKTEVTRNESSSDEEPVSLESSDSIENKKETTGSAEQPDESVENNPSAEP